MMQGAGFSMGIQVKGLDKAMKKILSNIGQFKPMLLKAFGLVGESELKKASPVKTGRLRASIHQVIEQDLVRVVASTDYAQPVLGGMPAQRIVPVSASVLHFVVGGQDVFCMYVDHPGFPGVIDDVKRTVEQQRPEISRKVAHQMGW